MNYGKGAKKVFISSTCLDLIDVRAELKRELEALGYIAYTSETNDFPVRSELFPTDNCLAVLAECDIYILIIHSRYGSPFDGRSEIPNLPADPPGGVVSVTFAEFLTARRKSLETRVWVRDSIWDTRPIFRMASPGSGEAGKLPAGVDPAVYGFIDYIQDSPETGKSWINQFHDITDLKTSVATWLKEKTSLTEIQFKEEVSELFRLQGYELNPEEPLGHGTSRALARKSASGFEFETEVAVWTYYHPAGRAARWEELQPTLLEIKNDLSMERYERAFLVVSAGYGREVADNLIDRGLRRKVLLRSYDDLIAGLIDFNAYIKRLVHDYEHYEEYADPASGRDPVIAIMRRCNLFKYFVPLRAKSGPDAARKFDGELEAFVNAWLAEEGRNHLTILGDFGTGKSSFALWLTCTLAKRLRKDGWQGQRVPVFISLRDHAGKVDAREIITNTLMNTFDIRKADYKSFEKLLEAGRLLLILDGFDETATLTDTASTLRILRGLNSLVRRNSKVILTCRSHYFRTDEETRAELGRSLNRETELFVEQKGRNNFEIIHLREFRRDQIELFLEKHYGGDRQKARATLAKMQSTYNLPDLSRRPVMLEMILKVWPRLIERSRADDITPALLYGEYVDAWIHSVAKGNEDLMDEAAKRRFCEDLTKWMYREDRELLPYGEIALIVREYFKDRPPAVYAALDTEVRTCTFLNRDSVGNYQFAHRSFMEFFVAKACAAELASGEYDLLKLRPLSSEIVNFLRGLVSDPARCWSAVRWTQGKSESEVGYVGGNAASLLALIGESFEGVDLEGAVMPGADLSGANLTGSVLRGASLRGVKLFNATLDGVDCGGADLTDARIGELGSISCLAWNPDGTQLAIGGEDGNIRLLDTSSGKLLAILKVHDGAVRDMAFAPGQNLLLSLGGNVIVWDLGRGVPRVRLGAVYYQREDYQLRINGPFHTVSAPDGSFEVKLSAIKRSNFYSNVPRFTVEPQWDQTIVVKDWASAGAEVFRSPPHDGMITTVCYAPTDSVVAVGTAARKVYVWDTFTGVLTSLFEEKPVTCQGMNLKRTKGLDAPGYLVDENTAGASLLEWLVERGAPWPDLWSVAGVHCGLYRRLDKAGVPASDSTLKLARDVLRLAIADPKPLSDDGKLSREALSALEDADAAVLLLEQRLATVLAEGLATLRALEAAWPEDGSSPLTRSHFPDYRSFRRHKQQVISMRFEVRRATTLLESCSHALEPDRQAVFSKLKEAEEMLRKVLESKLALVLVAEADIKRPEDVSRNLRAVIKYFRNFYQAEARVVKTAKLIISQLNHVLIP